jgi:hypothetical protein
MNFSSVRSIDSCVTKSETSGLNLANDKCVCWKRKFSRDWEPYNCCNEGKVTTPSSKKVAKIKYVEPCDFICHVTCLLYSIHIASMVHLFYTCDTSLDAHRRQLQYLYAEQSTKISKKLKKSQKYPKKVTFLSRTSRNCHAPYTCATSLDACALTSTAIFIRSTILKNITKLNKTQKTLKSNVFGQMNAVLSTTSCELYYLGLH